MESVTTGIAVVGGLVASKDIMTKLLGPTAEYVGGELKNLVEKCNINFNDIINKAGRKAGDRLNEKAQINPRVLKAVINTFAKMHFGCFLTKKSF